MVGTMGNVFGIALENTLGTGPACITALFGKAPLAGFIPCAPLVSIDYFKAVVGAIIDLLSI